MSKTILITGATDGIGLHTVRQLADQGHRLLIHGRNPVKLERVKQDLRLQFPALEVTSYQADFADLSAVQALAGRVLDDHQRLDVIINNAGVYKTAQPKTPTGLDVRFVVNTFAPILLTQSLLPSLSAAGRVVNLSSAAQAPVDLNALSGVVELEAMAAYAQSKLALTIWSQEMARIYPRGPVFLAVNPGSLLGTKMVKEGWGLQGQDISIGADIIVRAALSSDFEGRSGSYFDNDKAAFDRPHPAASDQHSSSQLLGTIETLITAHTAH